ncbi:MAG TPA: hypothetical protein VFC67_25255 [Prolixibacteraceae bacterium]|nr:hypothetical protein [Prolixibacteraceae bacterium]
MTLQEFESEFKEKCRMESVTIKIFEFLIDKKTINLELEYKFPSMNIPRKFEIERIDFTKNLVSGKIRKKNFRIFINTFFT